jgi:hypothetical protein
MKRQDSDSINRAQIGGGRREVKVLRQKFRQDRSRAARIREKGS